MQKTICCFFVESNGNETKLDRKIQSNKNDDNSKKKTKKKQPNDFVSGILPRTKRIDQHAKERDESSAFEIEFLSSLEYALKKDHPMHRIG